jgi:hypothetical protein
LSLVQAARELYVTTGNGDAPSELYLVNPTPTAGGIVESKLIGPIIQDGNDTKPLTVNGMAFDAKMGVMYIHTNNKSTQPNSLFTLNLDNGHATLVGASGLVNVVNLAIDSIGQIYAWWRGPDPVNIPENELVKINKNTGAATTFNDPSIQLVESTALACDRIDDTKVHLIDGSNAKYYTLSTATGKVEEGPTAITNWNFLSSHGDIDPDNTNEFWSPELIKPAADVNARIKIINVTMAAVIDELQTTLTDLHTLAWTYRTTAQPSSAPSASPSSTPSVAPSVTPSASPVAPTGGESGTDCPRCTPWIGSVNGGRAVKRTIFGHCVDKCVQLPNLYLQLLGFECGTCE